MNVYVLKNILYKAIRSSSNIDSNEVVRIVNRNFVNIAREIMSLEKRKELEEKRKLEELKRNESKGYNR